MRKVHINNEIWEYSIGMSNIVVAKDGKKTIVPRNKINCVDETITPSMVKRYIEKEILGIETEISVKDKYKFKQKLKKILSEIIVKPNINVLSVAVHYDPNLDTIDLQFAPLLSEGRVLVFSEKTSKK